MARPLVWQNPVWVTRPVPPGRLPFSSTLFTFGRVGLPVYSHSIGRRPFGLRRPFPILSIFLVQFQPCDLPFPVPICRFSAFASSLAAFFARFQSFDFLRPFPVLRPSPFFLRPQSYDWLVSVYGGFKLLLSGMIVKT